MTFAQVQLNGDSLAWYRNDGSEGFTTIMIVDGTKSFMKVLRPADVDGDADVDLVSIHYSAADNDDGVLLHENDGSESFTTHTIDDGSMGAQGLHAADLDADGDYDVLTASLGTDATDGYVQWYQNDGDESFT